MDILIVAATKAEIAPSLPFLQEHNIRFLISGVGMLQAAFHIGMTLAKCTPDLIIQVGIGGTLDATAQLADIYQITQEEIFAFGAEDHDNFLSMDALGFAQSCFSQRLPPGVPLPNIKTAQGITVNTVHGNAASIRELKERYPYPIIESMEGAAAFYAAQQTQTPVLQYRAISNYVEPRNRASWAIGPAIHKLNEFLQDLLKGLPVTP